MHYRYQRRYQGPLRGIVFDWAGVTVDFGSRAPVQAFREAFAVRDVPISLSQAREPMGQAKRDHIQAILRMDEVRQRWRKVHGAVPTDKDVDAIYKDFVPIQIKCLKDSAKLIPGCLEAITDCRARGMKIGSSTGYVREIMEELGPLAAEQGYRPDCTVTASDVPAGRPAPWMCLENARRMGIFPMESMLKVDDTPVGIEAGLNAGMWTVGIVVSGNEVGLSEQELAALEPADRTVRIERAREKLAHSGAHWVIDTIADLPGVLDEATALLAQGERP
jgi:phosphonoacetaldehyde hydrolase